MQAMAPARHMSMLRSYTPADALTIGNASCGTIAIFLCLDYIAGGNRRFLWTAFMLLPLALVCDVLDGYVARLNRSRQSLLGAISIRSRTSFRSASRRRCSVSRSACAAAGTCWSSPTSSSAASAVWRASTSPPSALADADTGKVKYFEGTPIPTSILIVVLLGVGDVARPDRRRRCGSARVAIGPALLHPLALLYGQRQRDDQRDAPRAQTMSVNSDCGIRHTA